MPSVRWTLVWFGKLWFEVGVFHISHTTVEAFGGFHWPGCIWWFTFMFLDLGFFTSRAASDSLCVRSWILLPTKPFACSAVWLSFVGTLLDECVLEPSHLLQSSLCLHMFVARWAVLKLVHLNKMWLPPFLSLSLFFPLCHMYVSDTGRLGRGLETLWISRGHVSPLPSAISGLWAGDSWLIRWSLLCFFPYIFFEIWGDDMPFSWTDLLRVITH